jgi:hypothetical protein
MSKNIPTLVSFVVQRDSCSRLLGEFSEDHLHACKNLVIVWRTERDDINVLSSEELTEQDTEELLTKAICMVRGDNGTKAIYIYSA